MTPIEAADHACLALGLVLLIGAAWAVMFRKPPRVRVPDEYERDAVMNYRTRQPDDPGCARTPSWGKRQ